MEEFICKCGFKTISWNEWDDHKCKTDINSIIEDTQGLIDKRLLND